jgi:hypothetical protein
VTCCSPRDDDEDTPDRSHKPVPEWAKPAAVLQALKAQRHIDPDSIFGKERPNTCDLTDMFKGRAAALQFSLLRDFFNLG